MKKIFYPVAITAALAFLSGCKDNNETVATVDTNLNTQVISDFSVDVAAAEYTSLAAATSTLYTQTQALSINRSDDNLEAAQKTWREARLIWEQSEAQLFGPVESDDIDPKIDSWPVDFNQLDSVLNSDTQFTVTYINGLDETLKGFHPIEYILWGTDGKKKAADLTDRELQFLVALALDVKTLTANLNGVWDITSTTNFYADFSKAGTTSSTYTQQAALEQLVAAMADICGEVAESKMAGPFYGQNGPDSTLEESPFAKSSMTDFINNITGIQNVYTGKFTTDGKGIEDIVRQYNLSLDNEIKTNLAAALSAMNAIDEPFGKAIYTDRAKVQSAMDAIGTLKTSLEDDLLPFVVLHSK